VFRGLPRRLSLAYGLLISATVTALGLLAAEDPEHIARNAFLVGLGATAVGWAMAYLLTYRRLRTIRHLTEVALSMARGRFGQRVVGEAPDEAGELAYAFNRMADAVGELVARLSQERSRLAAAYESSSNGIVAVTRGRLVAYINPAGDWYGCCFDAGNDLILGNVYDNSLAEIADGPVRRDLVEKLEARHFEAVGWPCIRVDACQGMQWA